MYEQDHPFYIELNSEELELVGMTGPDQEWIARIRLEKKLEGMKARKVGKDSYSERSGKDMPRIRGEYIRVCEYTNQYGLLKMAHETALGQEVAMDMLNNLAIEFKIPRFTVKEGSVNKGRDTAGFRPAGYGKYSFVITLAQRDWVKNNLGTRFGGVLHEFAHNDTTIPPLPTRTQGKASIQATRQTICTYLRYATGQV